MTSAQTISTIGELRAFLLDRIGRDGLAEALGTDPSDGQLIALAREWFRVKISNDLAKIAKRHRSEYLRAYMRDRRADPEIAKKLRQQENARRAGIRKRLNLEAKRYYQINRRGILARREQQRRQAALIELGQITARMTDDDDA